MPIQLTIYHPDRLVIGRATGELTAIELAKFGREILTAGLMHYRKVIDVVDARPAFSEQELRAMAMVAREVKTDKQRGALAFVVDFGRGEFAKLFSSFEMEGRPSRVFTSLREARKWLAQTPVDD